MHLTDKRSENGIPSSAVRGPWIKLDNSSLSLNNQNKWFYTETYLSVSKLDYTSLDLDSCMKS